jgi:non-specific serine/threonine protein kinase
MIGREAEIRQTTQLLLRPDVRIVTLTGPGGVGKTRLAISVAEHVPEHHVSSVHFVELGSVREASAVVPAIAHTLGIRESPDRTLLSTLLDAIGRNRLLLVLDNFEHLLDAAPALADLLSACPGVKALVTSRETLRISGEHIYLVPPLSLPPENSPRQQIATSEAVRLFLARASAAGAEITPETDAETVAAICRQLDCLPLAIELAAARLRHLSLADLLARLDRPLPLLTDGMRNQPDRHRTLRKAIAWSYELLNPAEQALFRRLSLFSGGFTLDSVESVCFEPEDAAKADAFELLASLADRNLIRPSAEPGRFGMLETIREFASEQLKESGERALFRQFHIAYYVALAERAEREFWSEHHDPWLFRIERDHANFRAAMDRALDTSDVVSMLRIAGALAPLWWLVGYEGEGRYWLRRGLDAGRITIAGDSRAKALQVAARLAAEQSDFDEARALINESLDEAIGTSNQAELEAEARLVLGLVESYAGNFEEARRHLRQSAEGFRQITFRGSLGWALCQLAEIDCLATVASPATQLSQAEDQCLEALAIFRELGQSAGIARAVQGLASIARLRNDAERVAAYLHEALVLRQRINDRWGLAPCFEDIADLALLIGDPETASRLYSAASRIRTDLGIPIPPAYRAAHERRIPAVRGVMSSASFAEAWRRGQSMSTNDAVEMALAVTLRPIPATLKHGELSEDRTPLTQREHEVLRLIESGVSNAQIAEALFISPATARVHVSNIMGKLDARSRTEAVAIARRNGWL